MRAINKENMGKENCQDLSQGTPTCIYKSQQPAHFLISSDHLEFLRRLEEHPSLLAQAPALRLIYDHLRTSTDWLPSPVQDGHHGIPKEKRIKYFGSMDSPFPLDLFLSSIDSMEDELLPTSLTCERGDYSHIDISHLSGDAYRNEWRKNLDNTIQLIQESRTVKRKDWGEPPNLEHLGTSINFIPHSRRGILSVFPPHKPHPLPPNLLTGFHIVPTHRVIRHKTRQGETVELEHGTGEEMVHETPHIHFMITPPGLFTWFHHDLPIGFINYDHDGDKLWLIYPATKHNMEQWYSTTDSDWFRSPQWAFQNLKGLKVCITSPGERYLFQPGYFHACFSLTPVIQSAQEYINHDELTHILHLQRDGLRYLRSLPEGHNYSRLTETITSWSKEIDNRFFQPFRSMWKNEWDSAVQQMNDDIEAEENAEEGDNEVPPFSFNNEEF